MDPSTLSDSALLGLIATSQPDGLNELYDRYGRLVFSLAFSLVGDRSTAEEITQDVFMRVWERAGLYSADAAKVSTWLMTITRYRCIDVWRKRNVRPDSRSISWADVSPRVMPNVAGAEQATELALRQEQVHSAIAQLPASQKEALALAYFGGLTHREIAETLGAPLGTVKSRIRLGMRKLRTMLADERLG